MQTVEHFHHLQKVLLDDIAPYNNRESQQTFLFCFLPRVVLVLFFNRNFKIFFMVAETVTVRINVRIVVFILIAYFYDMKQFTVL